MKIDLPILILLLSATLDYLIADPRGWLHPVQIMGWIISTGVKIKFKYCKENWQAGLAGIILGLGLINGSFIFAYLIIKLAIKINFYFGFALNIILLASCFAGKSLRLAAVDVLAALKTDDLELARSRLSLYVGRDTENLSRAEVLRALLETVSENAIDGVTAPLFYAIIGAFLPTGSLPLALAYKASSTLDSMIGYRQAPYTYLGWFSAQLEDRLTWLPCRLTVFTLGLLSRKPVEVWGLCRRDAPQDASPNSGWSECIYAAILGVQLGGMNTYQGVVKYKPLLGDALEEITPEKIQRALELTRYCCLIWLAVALIINVGIIRN